MTMAERCAIMTAPSQWADAHGAIDVTDVAIVVPAMSWQNRRTPMKTTTNDVDQCAICGAVGTRQDLATTGGLCPDCYETTPCERCGLVPDECHCPDGDDYDALGRDVR